MRPIKPLLQALSVVFILGGCYALFPTNNSTVDGWGYACEIKYGHNLFRPHHLLYNAWGYCCFFFGSQLEGFDIMHFLKFQNAIFGALSLGVVWRILLLLAVQPQRAVCWLFFVGSSYAVMRYSTENETYVIPVFFSLLSSLLFIKAWHSGRWVLMALSGLAASIACLFHQVQVFWLVVLVGALLIGRKPKFILAFGLPMMIIPIVYIAVLVSYQHQELTIVNLLRFVSHDYTTGAAATDWNWTNFVLTPINFVRSFIQVHGLIALLLKQSAWFYLIIITSLAFVTYVFWVRQPVIIKHHISHPNLLTIHVAIFVVQLAFAAFSHGNAEFMVMLPFLLPLVVERWWQVAPKAIISISSAMLVWNLGFAIVPSSCSSFYDDSRIVQFIKSHPNDLFIVTDKNLIANEYEYIWGDTITNRLITPPLDQWLKQHQIEAGTTIYTDVVDRPKPLSRGSLLEDFSLDHLFTIVEPVEVANGFLGKYSLYKIEIAKSDDF